MPIHLEFKLTFEDYLDVSRLHAKSSLWWRINWIGGQFIAPVLGVIFIAFGLWTLTWGMTSFFFWILMACGLFLAAKPLYRRFWFKRCFRRTQAGSGDCSIDFDETLIRIREQGARGEVEWSALRSFAENEKLFLLYLAPARFIQIPKRVCTADQADELRNLFRERIGSSDKARASGEFGG